MERPRWHVEIHYQIDAGILLVDHDIEELSELHDLIERGPDWNTIDKIEVTLARVVRHGLTVEQAEVLR